MKGAKLVLFVTGLCQKRCFYCPISEKRKGKDKSWANERLVKSPDDIIKEAERMRSLGAGVTGGDPSMRLKRTVGYIKLLKEHFDPFHVHMYTAYPLDKKALLKLQGAGLDELRFHLWGRDIWKSIERAVALGIYTGIEIPAIPQEEQKIIKIANQLGDVGGGFLNMNELEFSETNTQAFKKKGYGLKSELSYAVAGSEETAKNVQKALASLDLLVHYCSSGFKDSVQLRKRLKRTAMNIKRDFEEVSEDGLLLKGVIFPDTKKADLKLLRKELIEAFQIPENLMAVDGAKKRIETTIEIAEALSRLTPLKCSIVEEYPTGDRLETDVIPLGPD
ncbi:radical SAM protein [archaeon]|nr:radical SAM protein [archaeon]